MSDRKRQDEPIRTISIPGCPPGAVCIETTELFRALMLAALYGIEAGMGNVHESLRRASRN